MMTFVFWVALVTVCLVCAFYRCRPLIWLVLLGFLLFVNVSLSVSYFFNQCLMSAVYLFVLSFMALPFLRRRFFSNRVMQWVIHRQPKLGIEEEQVLDAGGTWWECQFYSGKPNWDELQYLPMAKLTLEEKSFIDNQVTHLCEMMNDWQINHVDKDLPQAAWDYIKSERFWGLCLDKSYGGRGFSHLAHSAIVSKVASCSISAAYTVMVPNSLGPAELILHAGTDEQKEKYLPKLAAGDEIGCFGLTSIEAGSDAANIPDNGVVCYSEVNGQQVLGIRVNFDKRYITLAPVATLIGLAFQLFDPDGLLGDKPNLGITVGLVHASQAGVSIGHRHSPMSLGFMNGPIQGKDVFIPMDEVIGGQARCGSGWQILMECLSVGRAISMPALASAVGRQCFIMTGAYAKIRRQFHRSVSDFEGVQEPLARIGGLSYIIEAARCFTAQPVVQGLRPTVASAICKYHLTEMSRIILKDAMDIHCGHALQAGPGNILAEMFNGVPVSTVGEGANIMTRNLIIFGQGVVRSHQFLRDEITAARTPEDKSSQVKFDRALLSHVGFLLSEVTRGVASGLTGGLSYTTGEQGVLQPYLTQLNRLSNALVIFSDITLVVLGKQLKVRESLSARLGDVLSYLYLSSAVIKYYVDHGSNESEIYFVQYALQYCLHMISSSLSRFIDNFPYPRLVKCFRFILFPGGLNYSYPADSCVSRVAHSMLSDSPLRQRYIESIYVGRDRFDPIGRIERAWKSVLDTDHLFLKIETAIKKGQLKQELTLVATIKSAFQLAVVSAEEQDALLATEALRKDALIVDEFNFDFLSGQRDNIDQVKEMMK